MFHYFIRDDFSVYNSNLFLQVNGLRGNKPTNSDILTMIDNLTLYTNNKCGLTHGLLDSSWNLAGIGDNVRATISVSLQAQI